MLDLTEHPEQHLRAAQVVRHPVRGLPRREVARHDRRPDARVPRREEQAHRARRRRTRPRRCGSGPPAGGRSAGRSRTRGRAGCRRAGCGPPPPRRRGWRRRGSGPAAPGRPARRSSGGRARARRSPPRRAGGRSRRGARRPRRDLRRVEPDDLGLARTVAVDREHRRARRAPGVRARAGTRARSSWPRCRTRPDGGCTSRTPRGRSPRPRAGPGRGGAPSRSVSRPRVRARHPGTMPGSVGTASLGSHRRELELDLRPRREVPRRSAGDPVVAVDDRRRRQPAPSPAPPASIVTQCPPVVASAHVRPPCR